jgi:hypothetical protein
MGAEVTSYAVQAGLLMLGAVLGALIVGALRSGGRDFGPPEPLPAEVLRPDPGAPLAKPTHVHVWHRTSSEQTNGTTRLVFSCYECPAKEVREQEAASGA